MILLGADYRDHWGISIGVYWQSWISNVPSSGISIYRLQSTSLSTGEVEMKFGRMQLVK